MSYLGYKEVMDDTYECKHLSRIVIPKSVFLKYYPNLKQAIREKEKELSD